MESFTLVRLLPVLLDKLDLKQFALSGRSTSQALVYLLHLALDALDKETVRYVSFLQISEKVLIL